MSKFVANVSIASDTFAGWVEKTNIVLDTLSNEIITVNESAEGSNTSGNGSIIGTLSANTLSALVIRGGGVGNTANISTLTIGISNSTTSSNVVVTGYAANLSANQINITSNTLISGANLSITSSNISISTANVTITGGNLNIVSNTVLSGNTVTVSSNLFSLSNVANVSFISSNTNIDGGNFNVNSNTSITGGTLNISSNAVFTGSNTYVDNKLTVDNILVVSSNTYVNNSIIFASNNSGIIQTSDNYLYPGDGTSSNIVSSFLISDYKSAKLTVSAYDNSNTSKRVITEISMVFGDSNVHSTEYGTIFTHTKFMTFTPSTNSTHIRIGGVSNTSVTNVNVTILGTMFK